MLTQFRASFEFSLSKNDEFVTFKTKITTLNRRVTNFIKKIERIIGNDEINVIELEENIEY